MKKGEGLIFVLVFLLFAVISHADALILHNASDFQMEIEGNPMALQQAVDSGYMRRVASSYAASGLTFMGEHSASQIWVNVDGAEKTLLDALRSADGLCGSQQYSTYESSGIPNPGHLATEIQLLSGKSLQQAINDGDFCGCVAGAQKSCTVFSSECVKYVDYVACNGGICDVTCGDYGIWPGCNVESYVARGTNCGTDGWHSCDGAGNCEGFSGTGCTGITAGVVNGIGIKCWVLSDSDGYYVGTNSLGTAFSTRNYEVQCSYECDCELSGSCDTCSRTWYIKPGNSSVDNSCAKPSSGTSGGDGHGGGTGGGGTTPPSGGGCFLADTPVLMADGSYKEIKDISQGDIVASYDTETNQFVSSSVEKLVIHDGIENPLNDFSEYPLISLRVLARGKIINLKVTANHPFYNPASREFKQIKDFKMLDRLKTIYGNGIIIGKKELAAEEHTVVYNLEISQGPKNYLANGIIVHNIKMAGG